MESPDHARTTPGRLLGLYSRLLGPLIAGYLLFDKAFAYLHLPGTPLYVGEMVLATGILGALSASRYFRAPVRDEPILALLIVFMLWGLIRFLPEVSTYGLDAVRDSALWYYCFFALLACAALARSPDLPRRWVGQLTRLTPWLVLWLPIGLVLQSLAPDGPYVPFTTVPVFTHKPGNAALAALAVLGCMWLFPENRSARSRGLWSIMALVVLATAATQNRGGLLGAAVGAMVALAFIQFRLRLIAQAVTITAVMLGVAALLAPLIPFVGGHGRDFSVSQLVDNVKSLGGGAEAPGDLQGTVQGRKELWSLVFDKQVADGHLIDGSGFGPNLAADVGIFDEGVNEGKDTLRNPHNSHLNVLARMGLVGISLWIVLWLAWYRRLIGGCRRLARQGLYVRRQVAVLALSVTTAILVSTFFDPELEGPQIAVLLWTMFGVGVAVTSGRNWFDDGTFTPESSDTATLAS